MKQSINLQQALFGYDDGHRLLSSSIELSNDSLSVLLMLSDLSPGIKLNQIGRYWTGVPLRADKCYALMCTWPAPEMSRPGCVWTHAILISFPDMARFNDLGVLRRYFVRPAAITDYSEFVRSIVIGTDEILSGENNDIFRDIELDQAIQLVKSVYGSSPRNYIKADPGALDETLFAFWSQQWPRLRRSFSFRTASSKLEGVYPNVRFDVRVLNDSNDVRDRMHEDESLIIGWEMETAMDLSRTKPTALSRFLWRYGSDIKKGRTSFNILAKVFLNTFPDRQENNSVDCVLKMIAEAMPTLEDGLTLKNDLIGINKNQFSLLVSFDQLEVIGFFVRHPEIGGLPVTPLPNVYNAISLYWESKPSEVIQLAKCAVETVSDYGHGVLSAIASKAYPDAFFKYTHEFSDIRKHLVELNPSLLVSEQIVQIPTSELFELLKLIPVDNSDIVANVGRILLHIDDEVIVNLMLHRFPRETLTVIIEFLRRSIRNDEPGLLPAWRDQLERNKILLLSHGIIEKAQTTRFLAALAEILGYDCEEVVQVGLKPWITALSNAVDDVQGETRKTFLVFLLILAIRQPVAGAELIFERAFEAIHTSIGRGTLPDYLKPALEKHLPSIGLFSNWDICKRLRAAVISSYVKGNLSPKRFLTLTEDEYLMATLIKQAKKSEKGRKLIKRAGS